MLLPGLGDTIFPYEHSFLAPVGMPGSEIRLGARGIDSSGNESLAEGIRIELGLRAGHPSLAVYRSGDVMSLFGRL